VRAQADELRDDIDSGASKDELERKLKKLEREAKDKGEDAQREVEELRDEVEERAP
jgi:hypothetical protein